MKKWFSLFLMITIAGLIFMSCSDDDEGTTAPANSAPVVSSISAEISSVEQGGVITLTCDATDADGDALTYSWSATGGTISGTTSIETWTAPMSAAYYTITCEISDGTDTDTGTKSIYVLPADMVVVQGGTFQMGDHFGGGYPAELPVHSVVVSDFIIGKYEVTQSEWVTYMPTDTYDYGVGDNYPAYYVSWYEIMFYCNERSIAESIDPCYTISSSTNPDDWGAIPPATFPASNDSTWDAVICDWSANGYRLPTEAEWEYAARGGIHNADDYLYSGSDTIDDVAWYNVNSVNVSHPVGTKVSNQLGIHDMTGNCYEWCWDWSDYDYYQACDSLGTVTDPYGPVSGSDRFLRGGYFDGDDDESTVASRYDDGPSEGSRTEGFRVVRRP
ncbi:MAG: SUMF1/EgtB/PvdO family nonheme iron enzyme [Candidatus Delongbacteria bacterium]|nr:SUMF1/EgtB/PvdO family nonheme iron enzyme [Candidatus Delongbacteria bacterium]